jgi:hypothetical protein
MLLTKDSLRVGDLVRVPANSQLLEADLDGRQTLYGARETVQARLNTNEPVLGLVFSVNQTDIIPRYVGVMIEGRRWFVDDKYVTAVSPTPESKHRTLLKG